MGIQTLVHKKACLLYRNLPIDMNDKSVLIQHILMFFLKNNSQSDKTLLYKLKLPSKFALDLYEFLHKLSYHAARIFPGYQGAYQKITEDLLCKKVFQKLYKTQLE